MPWKSHSNGHPLFRCLATLHRRPRNTPRLQITKNPVRLRTRSLPHSHSIYSGQMISLLELFISNKLNLAVNSNLMFSTFYSPICVTLLKPKVQNTNSEKTSELKMCERITGRNLELKAQKLEIPKLLGWRKRGWTAMTRKKLPNMLTLCYA